MFFKRKLKISLLGRAGILYRDKTCELIIDSEFLVGNDNEMVVYLSRINDQLIAKKLAPLSILEINKIKMDIASEMKGAKILWE